MIMNSFEYLRSGKSALTLAGVACIGLAGCCTKRYQSAYYQSSRPTYYSSTSTATTREQAPTPTGRTEYAATTGSTNMVVPLYQESVNVGKREVEAGSVRLRKVVKTETINQPIELRHEEVIIDRDNGAAQGQKVLAQPFQEEETVIRLKREEPVIENKTS